MTYSRTRFLPGLSIHVCIGALDTVCVSPWCMMTPSNSEEGQEGVKRRLPKMVLRGSAEVAKMAWVSAFLSSNEASFRYRVCLRCGWWLGVLSVGQLKKLIRSFKKLRIGVDINKISALLPVLTL